MKLHYANPTEPVKEGSDITALCGAVVRKAVFRTFMDLDITPAPTPMVRGGCRKCFGKDWNNRLLYVICPGQESLTQD